MFQFLWKMNFIFDFITRWGKRYYKVGAGLIYYKVGQVLLQICTAFPYYKERQVVLQSRAGITKWGNYYKIGHLQSTSRQTGCPLRIPERLFVKIIRNMKSHSHHRCICVTCRFGKQLRQRCFLYWNYSLRGVSLVTL